MIITKYVVVCNILLIRYLAEGVFIKSTSIFFTYGIGSGMLDCVSNCCYLLVVPCARYMCERVRSPCTYPRKWFPALFLTRLLHFNAVSAVVLRLLTFVYLIVSVMHDQLSHAKVNLQITDIIFVVAKPLSLVFWLDRVV
jgi:hypothetical protein